MRVSFPNAVSYHPIGPTFECSHWVGGHEGGHCPPSMLFDCNLSFRLNPFEPPYRRFLNTRSLFLEQCSAMLGCYPHDEFCFEHLPRSDAHHFTHSSTHSSHANVHFDATEEDAPLNVGEDGMGLAGSRSAAPRVRTQGSDDNASDSPCHDSQVGGVKEFVASRRMGSLTDGPQTFNEKWVLSLDIERRLKGHQGCVNTIHVDPLGQYLLSGSDDTHLCLYNTFTWELLHKYSTEHTQNIFDAKFLPYDYTKIISCGLDGSTLLLDTVKDVSFAKHSSSALASSIVCSSSWPNTAYVSYSDGRLVRVDTRCCVDWSTHSTVLSPSALESLNALAMHERYPYTIACGTDIELVFLVDIRMNSLSPYATIGVKKPPFSNKSSPFNPLPTLYNQRRGQLVSRNGVSNLAFSERGDWMAVNFRDDDAFLIPWQHCLQQTCASLAQGDDDVCASTSPESSREAFKGIQMHFSGTQDIPIVTCSVANGMRCLYGRVNSDTLFKEITFLEDDTMVCTGSDDGSVVFWRTNDGKYLGKVKGDGSVVNCVLYPPTLKRLMVCGIDSTVKVFAPMLQEEVEGNDEGLTQASFWSRDRRRMVSGAVEPLWPAAALVHPNVAAGGGIHQTGGTSTEGGSGNIATVDRVQGADNSALLHSTINMGIHLSDFEDGDSDADHTHSEDHSSDDVDRWVEEYGLNDIQIHLQTSRRLTRNLDVHFRTLLFFQENTLNEEGNASLPNRDSEEEEGFLRSNLQDPSLNTNEQIAPVLETALHSHSSESETHMLRRSSSRESHHSELTTSQDEMRHIVRRQAFIDVMEAFILSECSLVQDISRKTSRENLIQICDYLERIVPELYSVSPDMQIPRRASPLDENALRMELRHIGNEFLPGFNRTDEEESSVASSEVNSFLEFFSSGNSDAEDDLVESPLNMAERQRPSTASTSMEPSMISRRTEVRDRRGNSEGRRRRATDAVESIIAPGSRPRQVGSALTSFAGSTRKSKQHKHQDPGKQDPIEEYLHLVRHLFSVLQELFKQWRCLEYEVVSKENGPPSVRFSEARAQSLSWDTCCFANPMFPWLRMKSKRKEFVRQVSLPQQLGHTLRGDAHDKSNLFPQDSNDSHPKGSNPNRAFFGITRFSNAADFYSVFLQAVQHRSRKGRRRWQRRVLATSVHRVALLLRVLHHLLANHHPACATRRQSRRYCALLARLHVSWVAFYMALGVWDMALYHCEILEEGFEFADLRVLGAVKATSPTAATTTATGRTRRGARAAAREALNLDIWRSVPNLHTHFGLMRAAAAQGRAHRERDDNVANNNSMRDHCNADTVVGRANTLTMPMGCFRKLLVPLVLKVKILAGAVQTLEDRIALHRLPHSKVSTTEVNEMLSNLLIPDVGLELAFLKSEIVMDARVRLQEYMQIVKEDFGHYNSPGLTPFTTKLDRNKQIEKDEKQVELLLVYLREAFHELRKRMRNHPNKALTSRILSTLAESNISTTLHAGGGDHGNLL